MKSWLLVISILGASCAVLKGPGGETSGPSGPAANPEQAPVDDPILDEEEGIDAISARLKQFNRSLSAKDFQRAGQLLRRTELSIENADELTRGHPEFEDKVDALARANTRFDRAVEQDRIERRNAAIAELIGAGELTLNRGRTLFTAMATRVPTAEDVEELADVIEQLTGLKAKGQKYASHAQYRVHAEDRDLQTVALRDRLELAQWQIATSKYLDAPITRGEQALAAGNEASGRPEKLQALQAATFAYRQCVDQFGTLAARPDYDPERLVQTALGEQSLSKTRQECNDRYGRLSAQLSSVQWNSLVTAVISEVKKSLGAYQNAATATERLKLSGKALAALQSCGEQMAKAAKLEGYNAKAKFASPFGKQSVKQIERSCKKRKTALEKDKPRLVWVAEVEGFAESLVLTQKSIEGAEKTKDAAKRALSYEKVVASLQGCKQSAETLDRKRSADKSYKAATVFGTLTMRRLQTECETRLVQAKAAMENAEREKKLAGFLTTLRGDEIATAKKHGVPSRIETVQGGRVFYYPAGPDGSKSYAFDTEGRSTNFEARWKAGFERIAKQVTDSMNRIKGAKDGAALQSAVTAGASSLKRCAASLKDAESLPFADKKHRVPTPFGKLSVGDLRRTCDVEARKQSSRLPGIDWQIKLERVDHRASAASRAVGSARTSAQPAEVRVKTLGKALGSFEECIEVAESLGSAPGASESLEISSDAFGRVTRRGLIQACEEAKGVGQKVLESARKDLDLENFIAEAKGDEKTVARRNGIPTKIETLGGGRVFVYTNKGKTRRIAFDTEGLRVNEAALEAASKK